MDIVVLVKRVPDSEAQVSVKEDGLGVTVEERYGMNFFDSLAVEEALRLKERVGGKVTAISLGHEASKEVLRTALAMGADEAVLIFDPHLKDPDEFITAQILATAIKGMAFDLVLCGKEAFDDASGIVGPLVAEALGIPCITMVTKVEVEVDGGLRVEREVEDGKEVFSVKLPALLTAQKGLNEPRVPSVMGVVKAMKAPIKTLDLEALGLDLGQVALKKKIKVKGYSVPRRARRVKYIKGDPEKMVRELIELLKVEAKVI